jgi:hypothetical protein
VAEKEGSEVPVDLNPNILCELQVNDASKGDLRSVARYDVECDCAKWFVDRLLTHFKGEDICL